jgi:HK97 family phage prohead protease
MDMKATSSGMLPVLPDRNRRWDSDAALGRVRDFTDSAESPSSSYKRAFLYYNPEDEENFKGYKLPIADVVDGRLVAIPRGIFAAAGAVSGSRGGVDLPADSETAVKRKINRYYEAMSDEFDEELESPLKSELEEVETKLIQFEFDCKSVEEEKGEFEGYGSIFGNKDLGNDVVEAGAFSKSLRRRKPNQVKMLWQHKMDEPIGVFDKISEDGEGLQVKGRLALGTQRGKEAYELMKMGALDGLSIGYKVDPDKQEYDTRRRRRMLKEIDLMEISLVTFPMNPKARVSAVKGEGWTIREWERFLRDEASLSRSDSKVGAKALVDTLTKQRDAGEAKTSLVDALRGITSKMKPRTNEEDSDV